MKTRLLFTVLLCMAPALAAAESGTIVRATQLANGPYVDAASLGVLRGETGVEILQRDGGWYRVRTDDGREGWVRLSSVRLGAAAAEDEGGGFWASLFSFTGRSQTRTASATTGIRGLSEEEIVAAQPNEAAVARLADFAPDDAETRDFAAALNLSARKVEPLPAEVDEGKRQGGGK